METERMDYAKRKALVYAAADEMAAGGKKPTMDLVRAKVGGSYSTLSKILNEWKRERAEAQVVENAAPEAITELATRLANDLWSMANKEAQLALGALKESITAENADLKRELADLIATADALQLQIESKDGELLALSGARDAEIAAKRDAQTRLDIANASLAERDDRIDELKAEISSLRSTATDSGLKEEVASLSAQVRLLAEHNTSLSESTAKLSEVSKKQ